MFNLLSGIFIILFIGDGQSLVGESTCGKVHLTVSSLKDTYLEMNWVTDCSVGEIIPEYIILSTKNIRDRDEEHGELLKIKHSEFPEGFYRTRERFGHPWLPSGWEYETDDIKPNPGLHCFPYWIASVVGNYTIDSKCFGIQPTWMNDNSKTMGNLKIGAMFIPGTHNSGSYQGLPSFIENYVLNQDRSVWTQLVFGIRYLDFRIGYYPNQGFFINHDLVKITKVIPILKEIRKFLQKAPKEVVILDFHRFPYPRNLTHKLHEDFVNILFEELGEFALPSKDLQVGKGPTVNEIWTRNKSLIICYADERTVRDNYWLWHPLRQFWGNKNQVSELRRFLEQSINDHRPTTMNPLWALMAELTPQPFDLLFGRNNLRKLAKDVNKELTKWFRDEWGKQVNIVATDYFLGNDLINVAINMNNLISSQ